MPLRQRNLYPAFLIDIGGAGGGRNETARLPDVRSDAKGDLAPSCPDAELLAPPKILLEIAGDSARRELIRTLGGSSRRDLGPRWPEGSLRVHVRVLSATRNSRARSSRYRRDTAC